MSSAGQDKTFLALLNSHDCFFFFFLSCFPCILTLLGVSTFSGLLLNCEEEASYSLWDEEIFIRIWHYVALETWHSVAPTPVGCCYSFCKAPLYVELLTLKGRRGTAATLALLQLPRVS